MVDDKIIDKRIEDYKRQLSAIVDAMGLSRGDIRKIMTDTLSEIINASERFRMLSKGFSFNYVKDLDAEIDKILDKAKIAIFNRIYMRATSASNIATGGEIEDSNSILLAFLGLAVAGKTLDDRISQYTDMMKYEMEAYIAVGFANGLSKTDIIQLYQSNIRSPHTAQQVRDAYRDNAFKARNIRSGGFTLGVGKTNVTLTGLTVLMQDNIFASYNYFLNQMWGMNGAEGWFTVRGSGYDCEYCDSMVEVIHPMSEQFRGYHVRCMCIAVPVYEGEV